MFSQLECESSTTAASLGFCASRPLLPRKVARPAWPLPPLMAVSSERPRVVLRGSFSAAALSAAIAKSSQRSQLPLLRRTGGLLFPMVP